MNTSSPARFFRPLLLAAVCGACAITPAANAQTAGTVTLNATLNDLTARTGTVHFDVVWVTTGSGAFIKTLWKQGDGTDFTDPQGIWADHFATWNAARGSSTALDGYSSTTATSYAATTPSPPLGGVVASNPINLTWNCLDASNALVADGTYKFWIQYAERNSINGVNGPLTATGLTWTKGPTGSTVNPANQGTTDTPAGGFNFTNLSIVWTPSVAVLPVITVEQPAGTALTSGGSKDFGSSAVGTAVPLTFTIKNSGTASLTSVVVTKDGTNSADYTVTASPASTVAANGNTTFTVAFNPSAGGSRTATLHIASNDATHNPFNIVLTGSGVGPAIVVEQPPGTGLASGGSTVDFGSSVVGTPYPLTFTIRNVGTVDLSGIGVTPTGTDSGDYTVTSPPAATVAAGGNTTFTVAFNPLAGGIRAAALNIASNDSIHNPFIISLTGNGMASAAPLIVVEQPAGTALTSDSGLIGFGSALVGGTPKTLTFTIRNTGTADLTGLAVTADGINGTEFTVTTAPAATVAARDSTTFVVTFNPTGGGTRIATLHIANSDATTDPFNIAVTGIGTTGSPLAVIAVEQPVGTSLKAGVSTVDFGPSTVGTPVSLTFTIKNTGTANLTGITATVTRREIASTEYKVTTNPATTVVPGDSTTCTVTFTPLIGDTLVGTLHIASNDQKHHLFDIYLNGLGLATAQPVIAVEDAAGARLSSDNSTIDFGSSLAVGTPGATPYPLTFTIRNTGTADLTDVIATITKGEAISPDFTISASPAATVAFGDSTTFTVAFNPSVAGRRSASLRIRSNSPTHHWFKIYLSGNGMTSALPLIAVGQQAGGALIAGTGKVNFGPSLVGSAASMAFTITNRGTADLTGIAATVDGNNGTEFTVITAPAATVVARDSTTFMVTFNPAAGGSRSATLHIASNDATHNPFDIVLTGMGTTGGTTPAIAVEQPAGTCLTSGATRSFPSVRPYHMAEMAFTVRNTLAARGLGPASDLRITKVALSGANADDFQIFMIPGLSIAPGRHTAFKVLFLPKSDGDKVALLTILNNDPTGSPFYVNLKGNSSGTIASAQAPAVTVMSAAMATIGSVDTPPQLVQNIADAAPRFVMAKVDGQDWPALSFRRSKSPGSLIYMVEESVDMQNWSLVPTPWQLVGGIVDEGNGSERITVPASAPMTDSAHCYLRVRVQDGP